MCEPASHAFERRWPVVLALLVVLVLLALLPERIRLFPNWMPFVIGAIVITPLIAVGITSARASWLLIERYCTRIWSNRNNRSSFEPGERARRHGESFGRG